MDFIFSSRRLTIKKINYMGDICYKVISAKEK